MIFVLLVLAGAMIGGGVGVLLGAFAGMNNIKVVKPGLITSGVGAIVVAILFALLHSAHRYW